ncbi:hypothetical protein LY474_24260 [Myxococcus stipitatus]|uniref:outer membrane protein assembly factor BamB family protein n=1 Tax=Myxococcus stipitatus TaxID=83455 RepID=UPI001F308B8F|nr:PQQ-binding-like beta-propeller repeat protein [Myxococcus stipitatus]MCE9670927.1 hypothetical protein [Myxococcus stipitatus]
MRRWWRGTATLTLCAGLVLACGGDGASAEKPPPEEETPPTTEPPLPPTPKSGDVRWSVHVRLPGSQEAIAVVSDGQGGTLLLGGSRPPGNGTSSSEQAGNGRVLTLSHRDAGGQVVWTRDFVPEPSESSVANAHGHLLAVASTGELFIAGKVEGRLRLGESLVSDSSFLAKLSPDGTPLWARATGVVKAVTPDVDGEVLVAHGRLVTRYDTRGLARWSQDIPAMTSASAVALDSDGGAVLAGRRPVSPFESIGFIARLSPVGEIYWEQEVGPDAPVFTQVAFTHDGGLLLTGDLGATLHWGGATLSPPCVDEVCPRTAFVLAADAAGRPLWSHVAGSGGPDGAPAARIAADPQGGAAVLWRGTCGSELERLSARGEALWRQSHAAEPCSAAPALTDLTFVPGGDVVGVGSFSGTHTFASGGDFTADDTDLFLQRWVP